MGEVMLGWYLIGILGWVWFCYTGGMVTVGDLVASFFVGFTGPLLFLMIGLFWMLLKMDHLFSMVLWKK